MADEPIVKKKPGPKPKDEPVEKKEEPAKEISLNDLNKSAREQAKRSSSE